MEINPYDDNYFMKEALKEAQKAFLDDEVPVGCVVVCNKKIIARVNFFLKKQLKNLPKKKIAYKSLKKFGLAILVKKNKNLFSIINNIAPEHLEICTKNPQKIMMNVSNAGSIFLGNYSPEAMGDYLAGTNHVLPTAGSAKFSSGLSVDDFMKKTVFLSFLTTTNNSFPTWILIENRDNRFSKNLITFTFI